jgi:hypothetical protein
VAHTRSSIFTLAHTRSSFLLWRTHPLIHFYFGTHRLIPFCCGTHRLILFTVAHTRSSIFTLAHTPAHPFYCGAHRLILIDEKNDAGTGWRATAMQTATNSLKNCWRQVSCRQDPVSGLVGPCHEIETDACHLLGDLWKPMLVFARMLQEEKPCTSDFF